MNPVVKHLHPRSQMAYNIYLGALFKMQQGFPRIAYELMIQAQSMMNSIYGPLHPDIILCHRLMARMAFAMGDFPDAFAQQQKASNLLSASALLIYINLGRNDLRAM